MHTLLNEQDCLNDLLNQEKEMVKLYSTSLTEASLPHLRKQFRDFLSLTSEDQYHIFQEMQQRKYYQTKPAQTKDIDQTITTFTSIAKELKQH